MDLDDRSMLPANVANQLASLELVQLERDSEESTTVVNVVNENEDEQQTPSQRGKYHYTPLDLGQNEVRLLVLHPAAHSADKDPVHGHLKHVYLGDEQAPDYETISYVWGDLSVKSTVMIDGCALDVPTSAEGAIRHLRHTDKERVLWLDAICIDQMDKTERGHQVGL